ncbi:MAG TPA: hypothetical protein VHN59_14555 [Chitinophagaceae bacterium]|nr:hypothetical protein [Chitinophagaceae bacterium]
MENFKELENFITKLPGARTLVGKGHAEDGLWWIKFSFDIDHPLAWRVVQELGHVINYLSLNERLPAVFYPISPPPYINGGPDEFLSWIIESKDKDFSPKLLFEWLEGRFPNPVDNPAEWEV